MAKHINIEFTKTYASVANAEKAVRKLLGDNHDNLRYIVVPVLGASLSAGSGEIRYRVLFIGESAIHAGIHFHFNCVN